MSEITESAVDKDFHKGHRQRLKQRFLQRGVEAFEPHEALELLLFYCIPQKNTNLIAHELLNRFGNITAVFDAPVKALCEVSNITENSAVLLKLIPQMLRYYQVSPDKLMSMDNIDYVKKYFSSLYIGVRYEEFKVCCLDNHLQVVSCNTVAKGSTKEVNVDARMVAKAAFESNSQLVILAHNHPNDFPEPSRSDVSMTTNLIATLKPIGIEILDHVIVGKNEVLSMKQCGMLNSL